LAVDGGFHVAAVSENCWVRRDRLCQGLLSALDRAVNDLAKLLERCWRTLGLVQLHRERAERW